MLLQLYIRNLALIREMEIEFHPGLNVLSGETGAGKSIVVDAVNLVLGERAARDLIAANEEKAIVEALFELHGNDQVATVLHEMHLEGDEGVVSISRELTDAGRNLCRINGILVPLQTLKTVSAQLLDIHGQHEHQLLLESRNHIVYLDSYGADEILPLKDKVSKLYNQWYDVHKKLEHFQKGISEREQRLDLLRFQVEELEGAELHKGETEELENKRSFYRNADRIISSFGEACAWLSEGTSDEGESACDLMRNGIAALAPISDLDEKYDSLYKRLNELYYEVEDAVEELKRLRNSMDFDQEDADNIESRLDQLHRLGRKYGGDATEMLLYLKRAQAELSELQNSEEESENLEKQELQLKRVLTTETVKLSTKRKAVAKRFESDMQSQLKDLGMKNVQISVVFHDDEEGRVPLTANGKDRVEFLFSANLGQEMRPLAKIASGGELSRIMLALKNLSAKKPGVPRSMVFDEIDTGISGRMAQVVAEKMCEIGDHHQVICVTHLPQIAAMADEQYVVTKLEKGEQTYTEVKHLSHEQRTTELARMIGGAGGISSAFDHAKHMLRDAEDRKQELRARIKSNNPI